MVAGVVMIALLTPALWAQETAPESAPPAETTLTVESAPTPGAAPASGSAAAPEGTAPPETPPTAEGAPAAETTPPAEPAAPGGPTSAPEPAPSGAGPAPETAPAPEPAPSTAPATYAGRASLALADAAARAFDYETASKHLADAIAAGLPEEELARAKRRAVFYEKLLGMPDIVTLAKDNPDRLVGGGSTRGGEQLWGQVQVFELGPVRGAGIGNRLPERGSLTLDLEDGTQRTVLPQEVAQVKVSWTEPKPEGPRYWAIEKLEVLLQTGEIVVGTPTWVLPLSSFWVREVGAEEDTDISVFPAMSRDPIQPDNLVSELLIVGAPPATGTSSPTPAAGSGPGAAETGSGTPATEGTQPITPGSAGAASEAPQVTTTMLPAGSTVALSGGGSLALPDGGELVVTSGQTITLGPRDKVALPPGTVVTVPGGGTLTVPVVAPSGPPAAPAEGSAPPPTGGSPPPAPVPGLDEPAAPPTPKAPTETAPEKDTSGDAHV